MNTIILNRGNNYTDKIRDYKIFINDKYFDSIKNDSNLEIDNVENNSKIQIRIDWCKSNTIILNFKIQKIIQLSVEPNCKGWKIILYPFYITLFKNKYLVLKNVP